MCPAYGIWKVLMPFVFDSYSCEANSSFILVISPLNALMIDQICKLKDTVTVTLMKAVHLDESKETSHGSAKFCSNSFLMGCKIVFAHPEALLEDKKVFQSLSKSKIWKENLKAIVVDEAHLMIEWKDFRPCYGNIGMLGSVFPGVPFLALTATATVKRKKEIAFTLGMHDPVIIDCNPNRPNIFFESKQQLEKVEDKLKAILEPLANELLAKRLDFPLTVYIWKVGNSFKLLFDYQSNSWAIAI